MGVCQLVVASTYLWSGLQKLNASFLEDVFPWLVEPLVGFVPGRLEGLILSLGIAVPFVEAGIGVGLLTRVRHVAVVLALGMHAFILFSIGPFGHDWNSVVWPWNLAMMAFVVILFWRTWRSPLRAALIPGGPRRRYLFHGAVLVLFVAMPALSFLNLWDSYLSASLYSGNTKDATLYVTRAVHGRLPEEVRGQAAVAGRSAYTHAVHISSWSSEEMNVPAYPESRVYKNVARYVCGYATKPSGVKLAIQNKPAIWDGSREVEVYDCSGLETGRHQTIRPRDR